ncbi:MAG: hypothetical protein O7F71_17675, partial [Gammaproteobacteria bacterium]|nr:hypothetical protein [Gammaproteobacteria bacterium]
MPMGVFSKLFGERQEPIHIEGPDEYELNVVGESQYQKALKKICGGHRKGRGHFFKTSATLFCEDDNPHDSQTVRVDIDGKTVGYLSINDARRYRRRLAKQGHPGILISCDAAIVGGWDKGWFDKGNFGVRLDLP